MKIQFEFPEYDEEGGFRFAWVDGFVIKVERSKEREAVKVSGNMAGLMSLARILLTLAQENVPVGYHIHLDELRPLEPDSVELILERI